MMEAMHELEEKKAMEEEGEKAQLVQLQETKMTFRKITELCLENDFVTENQGNPDAIAEQLLSIKVARLDWQGFTSIDSLDALTSIQDLYLQYNFISRIENLDFLHKLRFLSLGNNRITVVENLSHLSNLELLDLSHNRIEHLDIPELPTQLRSVDFSGNKCAQATNYRESLQRHLPSLVFLDSEPLYPEHPDTQDDSSEPSGVKEQSAEDYRSPLLDRAARRSKRPTSAVSRSNAMMEAALGKIESMWEETSQKARESFEKQRLTLKERSLERMKEHRLRFDQRVVRTVENTRPSANLTNQSNNM